MSPVVSRQILYTQERRMMKKYESHNINIEKVAEYFLSKMDNQAGDCISNLKLQKLVYYAQGFVFAITGRKLFNNPILAWQHGPVVKDLYDKYKEFGSNGIEILRPGNLSDVVNNTEIKNILDEVWDVYGQFSAWKLRNMTHEESPWKATSPNEMISDKSILQYFSTQIENG